MIKSVITLHDSENYISVYNDTDTKDVLNEFSSVESKSVTKQAIMVHKKGTHVTYKSNESTRTFNYSKNNYITITKDEISYIKY